MTRPRPPVRAIDPDLLLHAYASGVFPMADGADATEVYWVEPRRRGVLPLDEFRLSRSLAKRLPRFSFTADRCFDEVVAACADPAPGRESTWINGSIADAVSELHARGAAHSVECWRNGALVGGLYGVRRGAAFFGESMFSRVTDASKAALAALVARLRVGGFRLLDCQFLTDHLASLGAVEIGRARYSALLSDALSVSSDWSALDALAFEGTFDPSSSTGVSSGRLIRHSLTQTS